jgi:hypothetical protein
VCGQSIITDKENRLSEQVQTGGFREEAAQAGIFLMSENKCRLL